MVDELTLDSLAESIERQNQAEANLQPGTRLVVGQGIGQMLSPEDRAADNVPRWLAYDNTAAGVAAWEASAAAWQSSEQALKQDQVFATTIEKLGGKKAKKVKEIKGGSREMVLG